MMRGGVDDERDAAGQAGAEQAVTRQTWAGQAVTGRLPLLGRADLLRLVARCTDPVQEERIAWALGWERKPDDSQPTQEETQSAGQIEPTGGVMLPDGTTNPAIAETTEAWPSERRPTLFWTPVRHQPEPVLLDSKRAEVQGRLNWRDKPQQAARHRPLAEWRVLGPRLRPLLEGLFFSREPDLPKVVKLLAEARWDRHLPLRPLRRWGSCVQVVVDRSERLMPYFRDQEAVIQTLRKLIGKGHVEVYSGSEPDERRLWRLGSVARPRIPYQPPPPGSHLLVLGDLGVLDRYEPEWVSKWQAFGRRHAERGCQLLALVPCDLQRVPSSLRQVYRVRGWGPHEAGTYRPDQRDHLVRRLVRLIAYLVRVEPGLLREYRRFLPDAADPGLEAEVWQHPIFTKRTSEAGELGPPDSVHQLVREFESEPVELRQQAVQELLAWRTQVGCEVLFEELSRLSPATRQLVPKQLWQDAVAGWHYLHHQSLQVAPNQSEPVANYVRRLLHRLTDAPLLDPEIGRLADGMRRHFNRDGPAPPPPARPPQRVAVLQRGEQWIFRGEDDSQPQPPTQLGERLIVSLRTQSGFVELSDQVRKPSGETQLRITPVRIVGTGEQTIERPRGAEVILRSDAETYWLEPKPLPTWATSAGCDSYGLWADETIAGATIRWRYIPPGSFQMGSPPDEPGRWDDEGPQHWVTLSRGFWMGETACTQSFWSALMGENPSRFKSPERPVERVSWDAVQSFLSRLNSHVGGSGVFSLPTEAQWEYACRAGSPTALYRVPGRTGAIEILGENNAPALDDLAWYGGNSKSHTHSVGRKTPNMWGLYDMLGNVLEWCSDGMRAYSNSAELDPVRPLAGFGSRVVRGGGWGNRARYVRCAVRGVNYVGHRNGHPGFRLVRVQRS